MYLKGWDVMYMKLKLSNPLFCLVLCLVLFKIDVHASDVQKLNDTYVNDLNLVRNPSFERQNLFDKPDLQYDIDEPVPEWDGLGGWYGTILPGTISVNGNLSVLFSSGYGARAWLEQRGIPVQPGEYYLIQSWFRTVLPFVPQGVQLGAYIKVWGQSKEKPLFEKWLSGVEDWHQVNGVFLSPEGTKYITIDIGLEGLGGYFWVDDVRLSEIVGFKDK